VRDPKGVVAAGYDRIWRRYEEWNAERAGNARIDHLDAVLPLLRHRRSALDLGCGTGSTATYRLAEEFETVTGVDISTETIEAARARLPMVGFIAADMIEVDLPDEAYDLVTAFYSVIHVPRDEQLGLVGRISRWLAPGGVLLVNLAASAGDGYEEDWLGAPMYWSAWDESTSRSMISRAGLELVGAEVEHTTEHGEPVAFLWVVASKPDRPIRP